MESDMKFIVLERIRSIAHLLKKSNVSNELVLNGKSVLSMLKELQYIVRFNELGQIEEKAILLPFLHILSSRTISGPYVRNVTDALQAFLNGNVLLIYPPHGICEALRHIASAVISCKFIHTDIAGDEVVQMQMLETLRCLVNCPAAAYMSEHTQWSIIEFCCFTLSKTGGPSGSMVLYQAAERTVTDAVALLLALSRRAPLAADGGHSFSTGVPSLCRTLEYVVRVLTEAAGGSGGKADAIGAAGQRSSTPPVHHRSTSHGSSTQLPINETSGDRPMVHVLFVLKLLRSLLTSASSSAAIKLLLVRSKEFARLVGDELGFALLQLSGGSAGAPGSGSAANGASTPVRSSSGQLLGQQLLSSQGSPAVLSAVLGVFEALLHVAGPCLRILVECFVRQVYLRALMQTHQIFIDQLQFLGEGMDLVSPFVKLSTAKAAAAQQTGMVENGFRLDEIEAILESLSDLLSEGSLLTTWFASFDCDPTSADLVQPVVEYICRCSCLAWTFSSEFMGGYFKETGSLVTQLFKHICKTLHLRSERKSAQLTAAAHTDRAVSIAALMKSSRGAKHILAKAAELFVDKPEKGLRFLQDRGSLPTPLTPEAVAAFLRLAPDLPKETAGAFLGELGKADAAYEGNSVEFHKQALLRYVESFEFSNQSVLDCMRIFLSAFRLPGEAQQIDRILVAFSEHCFSQCLEGRQGTLENAEVTYILTFSIIMLNTDRHNPNVRADRKMTVEQFIRTNTNYGTDAHQTIPLTKEFLTSIYNSISEFPIRTEGKELAGVVTSEVWKDSQMQARADARRAVLVTTQHNPTLLKEMLAHSAAAEEDCATLNALLREVSPAEAAHNLVTPASIVRRLLASKQRTSTLVDPLLLSMEVTGQHALLDADMLGCVWLDLLRVCLSVHVHNAAVMHRVLAAEMERDSFAPNEAALDRAPSVMKNTQIRKLISTTNALLTELLHVTNSHRLHYVMDCSNLVLLSCAGMVTGPVAEKLIRFLAWGNTVGGEDVASKGSKRSPSSPDSPGVSSLKAVDPAVLLYQFRHFESARLATSTLLHSIHHNQGAITAWSAVWFFLGGLRDCGMLPKEMVLDADVDLLPVNIREEFEAALMDIDRRTFDQHRPVAPKRVRRQSSSILSLQGLGEVFFGGSTGDSEENGEDGALDGSSSDAGFVAYNAELAEYKHLFRLDALSARWDAGYEESTTPRSQSMKVAGKGGHARGNSSHRQGDSPLPDQSQGQTIPAFSIVDGGATMDELRALVSGSGVGQLVSDSRFLSEASLEAMLKSLVCVTECKDEAQRSLAEFAEAALAEISDLPVPDQAVDERWGSESFLAECTAAVQNKHSFSSSSVAWLEMVLVEVSLRNRDRFQSFWPTLKHHYVRVLCGTAVGLSYVTERRVLGILKICTRMISRDNFSGTILELLGRIFARTAPTKNTPITSPLGTVNTRTSASVDDEEEGGYTLSKPHFPPMSGPLLHQLSNQIAASMWRVLTLNVDVLPMLPLEQWQTLFTIIAISAASGGFAAMKSFESMAWLLHEPRLVAKVPVFCIIGVKPLLKNPLAPLSVSVGAVHLLTHLHGRLEVLIREDKEDYVDCEFDETSLDGDTPLLWESCWTPILRALGEGIADTRPPVREACAEALCQAILDRHSFAVPAGVLVDILGGIIAPMIVQLRDHLVDEVNRSLPAGLTRLLTAKEASALAQQQWVNIDADAATSPVAAGGAVGDTTGITGNAGPAAAPRPDALASLRGEVRSGGTVSVLMECLSALCRSFLHHLKKLAVYPSFDKLWLCVLTVLGHFLDCHVHGAAELAEISGAWERLDEGTKLLVQDLYAMLGSSKDHLLRMLRALQQEQVFASRPGLLSVTVDSINNFEDCKEHLQELRSV